MKKVKFARVLPLIKKKRSLGLEIKWAKADNEDGAECFEGIFDF